MAAVVEALDGLAAAPVQTLGDRELGRQISQLLAARNRIDALLAERIAEADHRRLGPSDDPGSGRVSSLLQELAPAQLGGRDRNALLRRGKGLSNLPLLAALHARNERSTALLDAAIRGVGRLCPEGRAEVDRVLSLPGSATVDPSSVAELCEQIRQLTEPDDRDDDAAVNRSELKCSPFGSDGAFALNGTLFGLPGELVHQMLQLHSRPLDETDRTETTTSERKARALFDIFGIASRAEGDRDHLAPNHGGDAHVVILAPLSAAQAEPGAPAARTADGQLLDPGQLAAVMCQARTGRITTDVILGSVADTDRPIGTTGPPGPLGADTPPSDTELLRRTLAGLLPPPLAPRFDPLAFGRSKRLASSPQWVALLARDGQCVVPGCARHAYWCEAHHLREWDSDSGDTDLVNLALVCWEHHAWLHRVHRHLHPPWCACEYCDKDRDNDSPDADRWTVRGLPPDTG